jgi:hypothetical protein
MKSSEQVGNVISYKEIENSRMARDSSEDEGKDKRRDSGWLS